MSIISGVVKDGLIVASSPLPEGARVEILMTDPPPIDVTADLQDYSGLRSDGTRDSRRVRYCGP
jgi:hypothetical protein